MKRENISFEDLDQKQLELYEEAYNEQLELLQHNDKVMANEIRQLKANGFVEGEHFRTIYYTDETFRLEIYDDELDTAYAIDTPTKLSELASIDRYEFIYYQVNLDCEVEEVPLSMHSVSMRTENGKLKFSSSRVMNNYRWYTSKRFIEQLVLSKIYAEQEAPRKAHRKMLNDYGESYLKIKYPNSKFRNSSSGWCVELENGIEVYFVPPRHMDEDNPKPRLEKIRMPWVGLDDDDRMLNLISLY